jgi:hypothetical protein
MRCINLIARFALGALSLPFLTGTAPAQETAGAAERFTVDAPEDRRLDEGSLLKRPAVQCIALVSAQSLLKAVCHQGAMIRTQAPRA